MLNIISKIKMNIYKKIKKLKQKKKQKKKEKMKLINIHLKINLTVQMLSFIIDLTEHLKFLESNRIFSLIFSTKSL